MVYHLQHGMSLRDHIASETIGAWAIDPAITSAGLRRNPRSKDSDIERTLSTCGKAVTPAGIEKCIVMNIEDFILDKPTPQAVDQFLKSIDKQVEGLDTDLYDNHRV